MSFLAGDAHSTPPASDEAEISIFGPGFGECILLHMREGEWVVVDSCVNSRGGVPVALEYLRRFNVDPRTAVKRIVATHWHDDHVAGLAEIVRTCVDADFVCSSALRTPEFLTLTQIQGSNEDLLSGTDEFAQILTELAARERGERLGSGRLKFALAQGQLWSRLDTNGRLHSRLLALSPSWLNPFENPAAAQFAHRWLGILLTTSCVVPWLAGRRAGLARTQVAAVAGMAAVQAALGIATLVLVVPIPLAAAHQGGAVILLGLLLWAWHAAGLPGQDVSPVYKRQGPR